MERNALLIACDYFAAMPRKFDAKLFPNFERARRERGPFARIGDLKLVSSKSAQKMFIIMTVFLAVFVFILVFLFV